MLIVGYLEVAEDAARLTRQARMAGSRTLLGRHAGERMATRSQTTSTAVAMIIVAMRTAGQYKPSQDPPTNTMYVARSARATHASRRVIASRGQRLREVQHGVDRKQPDEQRQPAEL